MCCPAGPAGAQGLAGGGEPDAGGPGLSGAPPAAARAAGQRGSLLAAGHPDWSLAGSRLQGHPAKPAAQKEAGAACAPPGLWLCLKTRAESVYLTPRRVIELLYVGAVTERSVQCDGE